MVLKSKERFVYLTYVGQHIQSSPAIGHALKSDRHAPIASTHLLAGHPVAAISETLSRKLPCEFASESTGVPSDRQADKFLLPQWSQGEVA
jgi:hypothetical protein